MSTPRALGPDERALLDAFLAHRFDGVAALRAQAKDVTARRGCSCGCGSIELIPDPASPASTSPSPVPIEALWRSETGEHLGGLLLLLDAGRLSYLEVYAYGDPLPLPVVGAVEWAGARPE